MVLSVGTSIEEKASLEKTNVVTIYRGMSYAEYALGGGGGGGGKICFSMGVYPY